MPLRCAKSGRIIICSRKRCQARARMLWQKFIEHRPKVGSSNPEETGFLSACLTGRLRCFYSAHSFIEMRLSCTFFVGDVIYESAILSAQSYWSYYASCQSDRDYRQQPQFLRRRGGPWGRACVQDLEKYRERLGERANREGRERQDHRVPGQP